MDSFYHGEGLKHALVAVGKVDDHYHICPPLSSISIQCIGQRPLWKKSSRSYNLPKPFETLKSQKNVSKNKIETNQSKSLKVSETSATLRNFVGFQIVIVKPLFPFLSFIGLFTKRGAILCSRINALIG